MTKKCKVCEEIRELSEFSVATKNKDGHVSTCKKCVCIRNRNYWRTPVGRISNIFATQVTSSKARGHSPPAYTRQQLTAWALAHGLETICETWKIAGYLKDLAPSVDRNDPNKPYVLNNIQLVTWKENNEKAYEDRKNGLHITRQNCKVIQLTLDNMPIKEFPSISAAARETSICRTAINSVCLGSYVTPFVGGYIWQYVHNT